MAATFTALEAAGAKYRAAAHQAQIRELRPIRARMASDQALTSNSSTLQNITDLVCAVEANTTYRFEATWVYMSGTTADIKFAVTFPTGTTCDYFSWGLDTTLAVVEVLEVNIASGTAKSYGGAGTASARFVQAWGTLSVGANAGNLQVQAAQITPTVEVENVKAGSKLTLWQEV